MFRAIHLPHTKGIYTFIEHLKNTSIVQVLNYKTCEIRTLQVKITGRFFFMEKGNLFGLNCHKSVEDYGFVDSSSQGPLYILMGHRL